jgi:hypothetical protein
MLSSEVLLIAVAIGVYVADSALLLYKNEGVLAPKRRGCWTCGFGSDQGRLLGRELFLPNPFTPHRPVFRLSWHFEGGRDPSASAGWTGAVEELNAFAPLVWGMALALFIVVPAGLFTHLGNRGVWIGVAMLYLNILVALGWLYTLRTRLRLSARRFAILAFESLVCPPCALNLVRKVALEHPTTEEFPAAAKRLLSSEDWEKARTECLARIDEEIESEVDGSRRIARLQAHRVRFLSAEYPGL